MFPIEDGSQPQYNVFAGDVEELNADAEWAERYRESLTLVAAAWGWDLARGAPISEPARGQAWTDWDIRLAKMIRSTWLFGATAEMVSLQVCRSCRAVTRLLCQPLSYLGGLAVD
eukprot:COSAG05_NODE_1635_length_4366_cov_25.922428_4_plen_115_part_00